MSTTVSESIDASGFDERSLVLLGVLMMENQHGYQINDLIENRLCSVVSMKKPTAYALLDRLAKHEAVTVHVEQEGSRPPRKVHQITDKGRVLFMDLLHRNLSDSDVPTFAVDIGLMFMNYLPANEVVAHLKQRLEGIQATLSREVEVPSHGPNLRLDIALDHSRAMRLAERDWLVRTIESIKS